MRKIPIDSVLHCLFEPELIWQKVCKWAFNSAVFLAGLGIFLGNLSNILAYEHACANPVYVQATIHVEESVSLFGLTPHYDELLSYEYEGRTYHDVLYSSSQNINARSNEGSVITVAVDPQNPGQLVKWMLKQNPAMFGPLLIVLGGSLFCYGFALQNGRFRRWRVEKANRRRKIYSQNPDYLKDVFWFYLPMFVLLMVAFAFIFPHTYSMVPSIE